MKNPSISGMPSVSIHFRYELFFSAIGCVEILGSIVPVSFFVNYLVVPGRLTAHRPALNI
jgi:hypothetical protein